MQPFLFCVSLFSEHLLFSSRHSEGKLPHNNRKNSINPEFHPFKDDGDDETLEKIALTSHNGNCTLHHLSVYRAASASRAWLARTMINIAYSSEAAAAAAKQLRARPMLGMMPNRKFVDPLRGQSAGPSVGHLRPAHPNTPTAAALKTSRTNFAPAGLWTWQYYLIIE